MEKRKNIILTGFMGTGKTTIGRKIAEKLNMYLVDMDLLIEETYQKPISAIFCDDGEAVFRRYENEVCLTLSQIENAVIATGGGTYLSAQNKSLLERNGLSFCLTCQPDELLTRLKGNEQRPLLMGDNPQQTIEKLLLERKEIYDSVEWQIDTTSRTVEELSTQIISQASCYSMVVDSSAAHYPITIGFESLSNIGSFLGYQHRVPENSRVAVITNPIVASFYAKTVMDSLRDNGYLPVLIGIEDGEKSKTLDTVKCIYQQLLQHGIERSDTVLALGGGVTGDIAGFAAATYYRGVRFIQVPTTLLAMVDSSIGGKTGVDLAEGKNLVGAFKQPDLVFIDLAVLTTLPQVELRCGMAEVIKHAIIGDTGLFALFEEKPGRYDLWMDALRSVPWLKRAIAVKKHIVEEDPYENGVRASLNIGHTLGHALETLSGFSVKHGEGVSMGMVAAARLAQRKGVASSIVVERIESLLAAWDLPVRIPKTDVAAIWEKMMLDKKKKAQQIRWVLPKDIGEVEYNHVIEREEVFEVLNGMIE